MLKIILLTLLLSCKMYTSIPVIDSARVLEVKNVYSHYEGCIVIFKDIENDRVFLKNRNDCIKIRKGDLLTLDIGKVEVL
jgi:hypothetical protein